MTDKIAQKMHTKNPPKNGERWVFCAYSIHKKGDIKRTVITMYYITGRLFCQGIAELFDIGLLLLLCQMGVYLAHGAVVAPAAPLHASEVCDTRSIADGCEGVTEHMETAHRQFRMAQNRSEMVFHTFYRVGA